MTKSPRRSRSTPAALRTPPAAGAYRVQATSFDDDGSRQPTKLRFADGSHDFAELVETIVAEESFENVRVEILFQKPSGNGRGQLDVRPVTVAAAAGVKTKTKWGPEVAPASRRRPR